jgi:hypothetical protein
VPQQAGWLAAWGRPLCGPMLLRGWTAGALRHQADRDQHGQRPYHAHRQHKNRLPLLRCLLAARMGARAAATFKPFNFRLLFKNAQIQGTYKHLQRLRWSGFARRPVPDCHL